MSPPKKKTTKKKAVTKKTSVRREPAARKPAAKKPSAKKPREAAAAAAKPAASRKAAAVPAAPRKASPPPRPAARAAVPEPDAAALAKRKKRPAKSGSSASKSLPSRTPVGPSGDAKLGSKWECFSCGAKFYDLNKPEPLCPKCGSNQHERPKVDPRQRVVEKPAPPRRPPRVMSPLLDEDEEEARDDDAIGTDDDGLGLDLDEVEGLEDEPEEEDVEDED